MSAAFTPGPWHIGRYDEVQDQHRRQIRVEGVVLTGSEVAKANARLISCAPDLLEFADTVVAVLEHCERAGLHLDLDKQAFLKEARRVIAKVEGVES